ncbi:RNA-dependent RNA polymerase 6-like [Lycium ferocissimum]|uniref:RNA-dependent RNA polymerase 6-like n=1 Tax=Lycium ferocissimum TaxID=112874 RepID=UPI0028153FA6|nr:RNA-dependent RNA polymerase 6-like [Lycium ferocissimum]XP_059289900.1 RNA-dependent RNA polymerase 6-like [Lycium ferocissimum]XP_059289902.1 RNA-dependent RNA polymerase 6-like [Lycium ferocissimum]XP_059289903.1 RNA-dependent RNA polymerase 6-like [Lycium ferocissimum]
MGSEGSEKDLIVTQISVGGFNDDVNAKKLSEYLEEQVGQVWRCRLKTSSTPPESYPNYDIDAERVHRMNHYEKVEPHAFIHFASSQSAKNALAAAGRNELLLEEKPLKVSLGPENPFRLNERRRTTMPFKFSDVGVEIGTLVSNDDFVVGWRGSPTGVNFLVDPFNGTCRILFTKNTVFSFKGEARHAVIKCNFKIEFLLREINEIKECKDFASLIILVQLASSPLVFYRTADDDIEESVAFDLLDDDDQWIRTTDITCSGAIGRYNTYRISIRPRNGPSFKKSMKYFSESRVPVVEPCNWQRLRVRDEPDFGVPMSEPFFCFQNHEGLSFKVLFLVNAVLHKGIVNQHQMTNEFFSLLTTHQEGVNLAALKNMFSYKRPVNDAIQKLARIQRWLLNNPNLLERTVELDDVVEVRRLVITPTKAYCLPPTVELSNRVLRNYKHVSDRFLRVTFMDEGMRNLNRNVLTYYAATIVRKITSHSNPQRTAIFHRVKRILSKGFYLCGRKYSFLAFSANQLRDRSAWFFAEAPNIRVPGIINWMGKFSNRNIAKCAARMGQCFSSTYATVEVLPNEVNFELPDVKRNGYVFSDGVGMISADLAIEVAEKLHLSVNPPCAYQIRYAGYKGVITCWPAKNDGICLSLRQSMRKFDSNHTTLEICSWTRLQPGFLNRQIITLLSSLDVKDEIFWQMQEEMLSRLDKILEDSDVAFDVITASCAEAGNTAAIMLSAGFKPQSEPHLRGMLASIRAAQLGDLRNKARMFVPSGRWLMGCLDELGELEQGQCFIQVSSPSLENCFVKHGPKFSDIKKNLQVIKGLVVIAKNPCLHPGDVRILEAIDIPGLHHLYDCLVFPQKGDRPHSNEASGSDLDGDLYFVTWDENLIPPSKKSWIPMDYAPAEVKELGRQVNHTDIIEFFSKNMVQESLGEICNAHVVHADLSESGALDEKCLKLAELAALAVDFPKTGKLVTMPFDLKPKLYPDFMGKEEFQSYKSKKILGGLYRRVKDVFDREDGESAGLEFVPKDIPYDTNLEIPGYEAFIDDAWNRKCSYDGQLNGLLGQYKVNGEEEVVTGHIWSMPKYSAKKQGELKERLKHAYHTLRKEFRNVFEHIEPDFDMLRDDEKNDMYERKASAWYRVTYHPDWVTRSLELKTLDAVPNTVMLSFAWIAADYLARIKIRHRGMQYSDSTKPINSLGRYLVDKI